MYFYFEFKSNTNNNSITVRKFGVSKIFICFVLLKEDSYVAKAAFIWSTIVKL